MENALGSTFKVDRKKCVGCGDCAADCVANIIALTDGIPAIDPAKADWCIGCQHCLAVCPTGAVSILGLDPAASEVKAPPVVDAEALGRLVMLRRSCRQFSREPVDAALLDRLVALAAYAPTGVNNMGRLFTIIGDADAMDRFRRLAADAVVAAGDRGAVPEEHSWLVDAAREWRGGGRDVLFRTAPHMLVVSNPDSAPCPEQDCLIALAYFEILAVAHGLGTVWAGIPHAILKFIAPELRQTLGMPADHENFYVLLFGKPKVTFKRSVQRKPENVRYVTGGF